MKTRREVLLLSVFAAVVAVVIGSVWWMGQVTIGSLSNQRKASREALLKCEFQCPENTKKEERPWSSNGWVWLCSSENGNHGPWLAAGAGTIGILGAYVRGSEAGVWDFYAEDGSLEKRERNGSQGSVDTFERPSCPGLGVAEANQEWKEVLGCGLLESEDCRNMLLRWANSSDLAMGEEPVAALAKVLLEEWRSPEQVRRENPRLVFWAKPDFSVHQLGQDKPKSSLIVVTGTVTPEGRVRNAQVGSSSGIAEIDHDCLMAFSQAWYRPAIRSGEYSEVHAGLSCHLFLE